METSSVALDLSEAVRYHYNQFPPQAVDFARLMKPLAKASAAIARYDQMLKSMHNSEILLRPLRSQEAVISSRIEGTISTLDEVLRLEADQAQDGGALEHGHKSETIEVQLYSRAIKSAQRSMQDGQPFSEFLIRSAHKTLMSFGRGAKLDPGELKKEQNFLVDRMRRKVMFIPITPEKLRDGLDSLFKFINSDDFELLSKVALAHLEFEALHPFKDGNGRIGRMMIPLLLWRDGALSQPYFYISSFFEEHKDEYIDRMRAASSDGAWTDWICFFLEALDSQASLNLYTAEKILSLYESLKNDFLSMLSSQWSVPALDFLFTNPVFWNSQFTSGSGIPSATAHRFTRTLVNADILRTILPSSGSRAALYSFEPLLSIVRR